MKNGIISIVVTMTVFLVSCGNENKTEENMVDTVVTTVVDTVEKVVTEVVTESVDTAAIIAAYEAAYAKSKSKDKKPVYKEKNQKQVAVYPEPQIESVAPANVVVDVAGYNYKADKPATYPGTKKAFDEYFDKNFEYPDRAVDNNVQGTIFAEIFIDERGVIEKVEFPGKKLGYGLEEEARRVIMGAKQLDPAIKNGVPAKQRYVLPIRVHIRE